MQILNQYLFQILIFIIGALPIITTRITNKDLSIAEGTISILILGFLLYRNHLLTIDLFKLNIIINQQNEYITKLKQETKCD